MLMAQFWMESAEARLGIKKHSEKNFVILLFLF